MDLVDYLWEYSQVNAPTMIDGAGVLAIASIDQAQATGWTRHVVAGELANDRIRQLAIAQYEGQPGFYLFYCDEAWTVVTDTFHDDIAAARDQARLEFGDVTFSDLKVEK